MKSPTFLYGFVLFYYQHAAAQLRTNFWVTRYEKCTKLTPTIWYGNITHEYGKQYLDMNITMRVPIDENVGSIILIEYGPDGKHFLELFTIRERYMCKTASSYLGEFFYDLERAAQIPPGLCPIRAGRYQIHHHVLKFEKISLQTFPFGKLRFTIEAIDSRSSESLFCLLVEVENVIN